jgi:DegV family protein with EDD domain
MPIRIVTDSTCDLPAELAQFHGISVLPMLIKVGEQCYFDGIDLTRQDFYERLDEYDPYPITAAAPVETFRHTYEELAAQGATEILSIHIASSLSKVVDVAQQAASETRAAKVTVFDSRQVSLGIGFLAESAAIAAEEGRSMAEILDSLEKQVERTYVVALLDLLEYMQRSGRMSAVMTGLGKMLKFKPLIRIHNGIPAAESVRTHEKATTRLVQVLEEYGPLERVALLHSHAKERAEELHKRAADLLPAGELMMVDITPVLGVHTGPGAMGFACVTRDKLLV